MAESKQTMQDYPTVRALIDAAMQSEPKKGVHAKVYSFPANAGLERYVLRVENHSSLKWFLNQSTILSPVPQLVRGIHIGQPLMLLGEHHPQLTILPRQQGMTLFDEIKGTLSHYSRSDAFAETKAKTDVMEKILAIAAQTKRNPFLSIMQQGYDTGFSGYLIDFKPGNIFIHDQGLASVDQLMVVKEYMPGLSPTKSAELRLKLECRYMLETVFAKQANVRELPEDLEPRFTSAFKQIRNLVNEAKLTVLEERKQEPAKRKGLVLANVKDIKAVSLDAPPHMLVERLKQLERRAGIAGYAP